MSVSKILAHRRLLCFKTAKLLKKWHPTLFILLHLVVVSNVHVKSIWTHSVPPPYFQTFLHLRFQNWNRHKRGFINGSNFYLTWHIIFLHSLLWLLHHMFHESWIDESWIYFTKLNVCLVCSKLISVFRINGK